MLANVGTQSRGLNGTPPSRAGPSYGVSGDLIGQAVHSHDDKLKQEVENLEAMLRDVNKKHTDDLRNLEAQKQRMSEEFQREKQSLEEYFEKENSSLQRRLRDVESSVRGVYQEQLDLGMAEQGIHLLADFESSRKEDYYVQAGKGESEKKIQEMQRRFDEEKREILNRASKEKAKLEDEVREAKEKLTSYRRLLEDEIDDLKRKHRKEQDYLHEKLSKERAEFEERLRITERNGPKAMDDMPSAQRNRSHFGEDSQMRRDVQHFEGERSNQNRSKVMFEMPATQNNQYGFNEGTRMRREGQNYSGDLGNQSVSSATLVGMTASPLNRYNFDDGGRMQSGGKNFPGELVNQNSKLCGAKSRVSSSDAKREEKANGNNTFAHKGDKCSKMREKRVEELLQKEVEKLTRIHEVEKMSIRERATRDKEDELSRIKEDHEGRLASERKRLQGIIDDFRRKMSSTERKVKDMEMQHKNEKMRYQEEKLVAEKNLVQSQEELKVTLEREYRKMLNDEKQKFDQTVKSLTKQISFLQDQRKEIQEKLLNNEFVGKCQSENRAAVKK
ncbi:hypothetical protein ACROYT_G002095 [Oculina patagonica]